MKKRLIPLLMLSLLLIAVPLMGTAINHEIHIAVGDDAIDSVRCRVYIDTTKQDSFLVLTGAIPLDSFVTIEDTANVKIICWYYFTGLTNYKTSMEIVPLVPILANISGADASFTVVAFDTTNVAAIQGTSITGYNLADQAIVLGTTDGNGQVIFGLKTGDTVYFNATGPVGYLWVQNDTTKGITNNGVDSIRGTLFAPAAPAAGKTAAVTIFVLNNDRTPAVNVPVSAYLSRSKVVDSAGFPVYNQTQTEYTDADGKVIFTCIWSSYMIPATKWYFSTSVPGTIKKKITIGREATITLDLR